MYELVTVWGSGATDSLELEHYLVALERILDEISVAHFSNLAEQLPQTVDLKDLDAIGHVDLDKVFTDVQRKPVHRYKVPQWRIDFHHGIFQAAEQAKEGRLRFAQRSNGEANDKQASERHRLHAEQEQCWNRLLQAADDYVITTQKQMLVLESEARKQQALSESTSLGRAVSYAPLSTQQFPAAPADPQLQKQLSIARRQHEEAGLRHESLLYRYHKESMPSRHELTERCSRIVVVGPAAAFLVPATTGRQLLSHEAAEQSSIRKTADAPDWLATGRPPLPMHSKIPFAAKDTRERKKSKRLPTQKQAKTQVAPRRCARHSSWAGPWDTEDDSQRITPHATETWNRGARCKVEQLEQSTVAHSKDKTKQCQGQPAEERGQQHAVGSEEKLVSTEFVQSVWAGHTPSSREQVETGAPDPPTNGRHPRGSASSSKSVSADHTGDPAEVLVLRPHPPPRAISVLGPALQHHMHPTEEEPTFLAVNAATRQQRVTPMSPGGQGTTQQRPSTVPAVSSQSAREHTTRGHQRHQKQHEKQWHTDTVNGFARTSRTASARASVSTSFRASPSPLPQGLVSHNWCGVSPGETKAAAWIHRALRGH